MWVNVMSLVNILTLIHQKKFRIFLGTNTSSENASACLINRLIVFDKRQPNLSSYTIQKQKLYFYIFTYQVKSYALYLDIF